MSGPASSGPASTRPASSGPAAAVRDRAPSWRRLSRAAGVLLVSQFAFNVGFFMVLPFLAVHLREDLALAGWLVGLVLGIRTFSQQGLFFVGGALVDRFGVRPVLLAGCATRIAGFGVLAVADQLPAVLVGTVLTGSAAALFSPAVETGLALEGARAAGTGGVSRPELFALDAAVGKVGALVGPVLGTALLTVGFRASCLGAAAVFGLVLVGTLAWGPREADEVRTSTLTTGWRAALTNRAFLAVAGLNATALLAYHQMYLALPTELERATDSQDLLGALFATAAVVTIVGQVPLARWARGVGARSALPLGSLLTATGLGVVAAANAVPLPAWVPALAPAVVFVVLLHAGLALSGPLVRDLVAVLARERALGAHYGLLASAGGLAVLMGSAGLGAVTEPGAAAPWVVCGLLCLGSTVGYAVLLRRDLAG